MCAKEEVAGGGGGAQFGRQCGRHLLQGLRANTTLQHLDCRNNNYNTVMHDIVKTIVNRVGCIVVVVVEDHVCARVFI